MKILLVNKFYYLRGGDCTAVFNTEKLLRDKGHEVAIFSMQNPNNVPTPWEKYFPKEVNFSSSRLSGKKEAAIRIFNSQEVKRNFEKLLDDFKPDVAHFHNIHSYISPLVIEIAHKKGIRTVWTMHDYKLICPSYACLYNGEVCEDCFNNKSKVLTKKCMKNSYAASLLAFLEAKYWNRKKLSAITDVFISPSTFLKSKMVGAGYPADKIKVLHNFMPNHWNTIEKKEDYYCYVGRLSAEKGVDTLLEAAQNLPFKLIIIGGGDLLEPYKTKYTSRNIEFIGQVSHDALLPVVAKAKCLVVPSIWYENNPFSIIESLCVGTPVIGANIGGIPELIDDGVNGFLFTPKNENELSQKIKICFSETQMFNYKKISEAIYNKFSPDTFYNKLIKLYNI